MVWRNRTAFMEYLEKEIQYTGRSHFMWFLFRDFALMQLENLKHSLNLHILFGSTRFGTDGPWPHLSSVGGLQPVMSLSHTQSCVWIDYVGNTWRFIMFSMITNIYNKKTKRPTLMELFTAMKNSIKVGPLVFLL